MSTDNRNILDRIEKLLGEYLKNPLLILLIAGVVSTVIRLYYFPHNVPIILDGLSYFWYAIDMSVLGHFPAGYQFPNNGWPTFLSLFFMIFRFEDFMSYMELQRYVTIFISILTVIPVYLLSRKFFDKSYALIASIIFIFDARISENSLLGITEASFIFLGTVSLLFILSNKIKIAYLGFVVSALFALVRYEGLLLIIPLSVIFLMRFRKENQILLKYLFACGIFILILLPMTYERLENTGQDGLLSHVRAGINEHGNRAAESENVVNYYIKIFERTLSNFIKYFGWIMIPVLAFFVPIGIFLFFRNKQNVSIDKRVSLLLFLITMLIPAAYAYSRGYQEPRYLLITIPMLCIISLFTIKPLIEKFSKPNLALLVLIVSIVAASVIFTELRKDNTEHLQEAYLLTTKIKSQIGGVNDFYPESQFLRLVPLHDKPFPDLRNSFPPEPKIIIISGFDDLKQYIEYGKTQGLTHLAVDYGSNDDTKRAGFLNDIFTNENNYPYLVKVFDSSEYNTNYKLKVFEIDYNKFESIKN